MRPSATLVNTAILVVSLAELPHATVAAAWSAVSVS